MEIAPRDIAKQTLMRMSPGDSEEEEYLKTYAISQLVNDECVKQIALEVPELEALLTLAPQSIFFFSMIFHAGMLTQKAIQNPENGLTIQIETREEDACDPKSCTETSTDSKCSNSDSHSCGCNHNSVPESKGTNPDKRTTAT